MSIGGWLASGLLLSGRPIASRASDDSCFELAKKWRDDCFAYHPQCPAGTGVPLPSRVIDVGHTDGSEQPYLMETSRRKGSYVALSHCWGKASTFVTNRQNLEVMKQRICMETMPKTFSDAITTVRKLGYRYLWIDSLCIVQQDHKDWVTESVHMKDYYKQAVITISADSAEGDHEGFLHQLRDTKAGSFQHLSGERVGFRPHLDLLSFRNRDTPVSQRAWTLQEFILSPRSLLFTKDQLVWECVKGKYCESDANSQDGATFEERMKAGFLCSPGKPIWVNHEYTPRIRWYNMIDDYFLRDITVSSDGLPAISGLAREIQQQAPSPYAAGLWIDDIYRSLVWTTKGAGKVLDEYRAPSWSWAALGCTREGVDRRVLIYDDMRQFDDLYRGEEKNIVYRAEILAHNVELVDDDPFGRLSSGSIKIRGRLLTSQNCRGRNPPYVEFSEYISNFELFIFIKDESKELAQAKCTFDVHNEVGLVTRVRDVFFLQLATFNCVNIYDITSRYSAALMLVRVEGQTAHAYRRVGLARITYNGLSDEENWELNDIFII